MKWNSNCEFAATAPSLSVVAVVFRWHGNTIENYFHVVVIRRHGPGKIIFEQCD